MRGRSSPGNLLFMRLCYGVDMHGIFGKGIFQYLLDFIFPQKCLGCARAQIVLCSNCRSSLPILKVQRCPVCERVETPLGAICDSCRANPTARERWFIDGLWVLSPYSPSSLLARLIKSLKYRSMEALAEILGEFLADRFPMREFGDAVMVPVPLHPRRERERGYNQARLLAQALGKRHGFGLEEAVIRSRYTAPQAKQLSREARLTNLADAFSLKGKCREQGRIFSVPEKILLIDDVCSTGATLNEVAKVLKSAGAKTVWGVVLARG